VSAAADFAARMSQPTAHRFQRHRHHRVTRHPSAWPSIHIKTKPHDQPSPAIRRSDLCQSQPSPPQARPQDRPPPPHPPSGRLKSPSRSQQRVPEEHQGQRRAPMLRQGLREITLAEKLEAGSSSAGHVDEATSTYLAWLLRAYRGGTTRLDFVSRLVAAHLADNRFGDEPSPRFQSDDHWRIQTAQPQRQQLLAEQLEKHPHAFRAEVQPDTRWGGTKTIYRPRPPSWRPTFAARERCFERFNRALGLFAHRAAQAIIKPQRKDAQSPPKPKE
jgi:hypothetical protein